MTNNPKPQIRSKSKTPKAGVFLSKEMPCLGTHALSHHREGERDKEWVAKGGLERMGWDLLGVKREWDPESPSASCLLTDSSLGFPCTFCKAY